MFGLSSRNAGARGRPRPPVLAHVTLAAACVAVLAGPGCSSTPPEADKTATTRQAVVAGAGDVTVTTARTVVNRYTALATNAAVGATILTVADAAGLGITAGDLLFVVQMQGAQVDGTNTAQFGTVTALNGAGSFETVTAQSVTANTITLSAGCGLRNAYSAAGHTQVVWVPQYRTLTVSPPGSITAPAWNGAIGGIVVIQAETAALVAPGSIDVSGGGFRGGVLTNFATGPVTPSFQYRSINQNDGAEKGESIAGFEADYDIPAVGGRYSLGAIANGGGGGAAHNGGGGGGANGNNGRPWSGAGVMPLAVLGGAAWALDPDDIAAGGLTNASGGGRGGYSYSANARNPLTVGPADPLWGGDDRQYRGGLGGRPVANDPLALLFVGGGGGAGNENNGAGGAGGAGGGSVYLVAGTVSGGGTGSIRADGAAGQSTPQGAGTGNDGPGGGGAGGSIVVAASSLTGLAMTSAGGAGGNQFIQGFGSEAEGPGGGGGGGFVAAPTGVSALTPGGAGGITNSPALILFPRNGATDGAAGQVATVAVGVQPPMCIAADLGITMTDGASTVTPGASVTYTIVATNVGPNPTTGATVIDAFGVEFTSETWACAGTACPAASGTGSLSATLGTLPAGANVTFTVIATVSMSASGTLSNTAAVAPPAGITDGVAGNDMATVTNTLGTASADVGVTLSHSPSAVSAGAPYSYTLAVSNMGPADASAVVATLVVPAGAVVGTITATGWTCAAVAPKVTCTVATIAAGASAPIAVSLTAPSMTGIATATATITAATGDPTSANNVSTDSTQVLCSVDADCGTAAWCTSAGTCLPKLANGQPLPSALPVAGVCTPPNGVRVCTTGVCDPKGSVCGVQLGDGTCMATTQCIAGVCIGPGPSIGKCMACGTNADCTAPTPTCNTATNGCFACNGDNATAATAPCPTTTNPYCAATGACTTCTANADCTTGTHAGPLCQVTGGACVSACQTDGDCGAGRWCNNLVGPGACQPKVQNGQSVPGGACTASLAARACIAGVCDAADNGCGYKNGDGSCTSGNGGSVCRSMICATSGTNAGLCEECIANADCPTTNLCNAPTNMCSFTLDGGRPDAGSDASGPDASATDAGANDARADAIDAGTIDAGAIDTSILRADGASGGTLEGGGCSCEAAGTSRNSSVPGQLIAAGACAGLFLQRRRRAHRG